MTDGRKSHARDAVSLRTGRTIPDLLRELYVERGFNYTEIGQALGVSGELIRLWVREERLERPTVETVLGGQDAA